LRVRVGIPVGPRLEAGVARAQDGVGVALDVAVTIEAGDAFAAGFLLALVRDAELKDAVDAGCAAAVTALSRPRANC